MSSGYLASKGVTVQESYCGLGAVERAVIMSSSASLVPGDFLFPAAARKRNVLPLDTFNLEEVEEVVIRNADGEIVETLSQNMD